MKKTGSMCVVFAVAGAAHGFLLCASCARSDFVKRVGAVETTHKHTHIERAERPLLTSWNHPEFSLTKTRQDESRWVWLLIAHAIRCRQKGHRFHMPLAAPFFAHILATIGSYLIWANALHSCPIFSLLARRQQQQLAVSSCLAMFIHAIR